MFFKAKKLYWLDHSFYIICSWYTWDYFSRIKYSLIKIIKPLGIRIFSGKKTFEIEKWKL